MTMSNTNFPIDPDRSLPDSIYIVRSAIEHDFCVSRTRCRQPDCVICEWIKGKQMVTTVDGRTEGRGALLSITLTMPPSSACLTKQIKRLFASFKRLIRQTPWK